MGVLVGELSFEQFIENLPRMPKQQEFLAAREKNAAIVGGRGCGKTVALCACAIMNGLADPNGTSLIGRLNMPALETSTMKIFLELMPEQYGEWQQTKKIFRMHNGHEFIFKHLDITDPAVAGHIKSMNLSAGYVDEANEVAEEVFRLIVGGVRRAKSRQIVRLSSNPAGHDWLWRLFFDPERKEVWKQNKGITCTSYDNVFLPPEYIENMVNLYPPDWADRFIYGHFSDFSDLVYKEFSETTHVWDCGASYRVFGGRSNPPASWPVIVGVDIGSDIDPWAIVLVAVAPDGRLYQFEEVYGNTLLIKDIASELKLKMQIECSSTESRRIDGLAYDYANRQAALELAEYDIAGSPAIKEVRPGLFKTAQYMHIDPRMEHPFNGTIKGSPRYFVSSACLNTRRELSAYKWAKDRSGNPTGEPEGSSRVGAKPAHDNSHSPDAVRYAIHTFRPLPEKLVPPRIWENPELDMASRMYWKDVDRFKDKMERYKPVGQVMMSYKEWENQMIRGPKRFVKPGYAKFLKIGHA